MPQILRGLTDRPLAVIGLVVGVLALLPVAVWLDLRSISDNVLHQQADGLNTVMTVVREYYARNVFGRVVPATEKSVAVHNYADIPGAIPIPATLSLELSELLDDGHATIQYRFVSDFPFANRVPHKLDGFELSALATFRSQPKPASVPIAEASGTVFDRQIRLAAPVVMGGACVACHNSHPESTKRDWEVGDVRGLQELTIHQPIGANIFAFRYLLAYFILAGGLGAAFAALQWRQAKTIGLMNRDLEDANTFLGDISVKLARYLSPNIYKSIFKGERDVTISTERKKLTIFFSDIKDFTATTERLQPEELTGLLNQYLTEMSKIAIAYGGTIDKYIGDAMLVFFGDPESKGSEEDARACLRMALDMQRRMKELDAQWRRSGIEAPFQIRCGINTGYCNVGNFGSEERMDYTIIGAEANLAARLEGIAPPGGIVISYETYALVRDLVRAHAMEPIQVKGISRAIKPYAVDGYLTDSTSAAGVISEHGPGLNLFIDIDMLDSATAGRIESVLQRALESLKAKAGAGTA